MPTLNPRITFTVSDDLMRRIDEYRFANRMKNQTAAIVDLINKGFASLSDTPIVQEQQFTEEEVQIVELFRDTAPVFQQAVISIMRDNPAEKKERHA